MRSHIEARRFWIVDTLPAKENNGEVVVLSFGIATAWHFSTGCLACNVILSEKYASTVVDEQCLLRPSAPAERYQVFQDSHSALSR